MALSKDSILKHAGNRRVEEVHIPAWKDETGDDVVLVHGLTIREFEVHTARTAREASDDKSEPRGDANARLIARCVVDADGKRLFGDGDVNLISNLGLGEILKLQAAIDKASGLGDEAEDEARGESETAQTASSSSE